MPLLVYVVFVLFGAFLSYLVPLYELPCVIEDCPERVSRPKEERTETTARSLAPEWPHGKVCSRLSPWARAAGWLGVQMPSHKLAYPIFGLVHFSSAPRRSPPLRPTDAEADADTDGQVGFSAHASLSTVPAACGPRPQVTALCKLRSLKKETF
ncbi:hypothetical protein CGCFRS4_v005596 [Colletotrichum fructicola]|nr:hypothetical protein CGCFRS4_v005596 [Colletotrichum fructicola]KAF4937292.1 hypothetical protein CGCF245_v005737 [Colletotrichum fructicola]